MAEHNIQTDSDAEGQFQPGVGKSDQVNRAIHQINPNWVEDGYGIIGPQRPIVPRERATPNPIDFVFNNPNQRQVLPGACAPTQPDDTMTTGTWVWGTVDGVCQWIDTTTCS